MNLSITAKIRRESSSGSRRYTRHDMASIKLEESIINSRVKRGELIRNSNNHYIAVCGCGVEGCFIHGSKKVE